MKNVCFLIIYSFLIFKGNAATNSYDSSSYSSTSTNTNLSGQTISSTTSGESAVYITNSGITISDSTIQKSGDISDSKKEDSEFYGINAAVLVQGGGVTIKDGSITTSATGGNAVCATNNGAVTISGTKITSTGSSSARGLHATYGGTITASDVTISSSGGSCATLATDRGEGTVSCTGCTLTTEGAGSPLIYSTGDITVSGSTGTANGAQMIVVEGKNTATVKDSSSLKCTGVGNREVSGDKVDSCGIFLYQSMSGDADTGTSEYNCNDSTLEILSTSSVYSSAPMFFITNTDAEINLENCNFNYGSGTFLKAAGTSAWGTSGSNGGKVTLTLTNQDIEGDFVVDENSSLTINMVNSSIKGKINNDKVSSTVAVTLDTASSITLTGNSYLSSLTNADTTGSNINKGSYTLADYSGNEYTATGTTTESNESASNTTETNDSTSDTTESNDSTSDTTESNDSSSDTTETNDSSSDTTETNDSTSDSTETTDTTNNTISDVNTTDNDTFIRVDSARNNLSISSFIYILFMLVLL